jgi:hypothetical protein
MSVSPLGPDSGIVSAERKEGLAMATKTVPVQTAEQLDAARFVLLAIAVAVLSGSGAVFAVACIWPH